jgi:uncharacterized membrane protein HdeD (DUF308 family)
MKQSNWLTFLINGILALIIGLLLLFVPGETILTLTRYFAILLMIAGVVLLIIAIRNIRTDQPYILLLTEALAALLIGILLLVYTRQSLEFFVILLGIWALIIGIVQVILSMKFKDKISNYSLLMINGFLTALLGILLFLNPFGAVKIIAVLVGILALGVGILLIYFAFRVKNLT